MFSTFRNLSAVLVTALAVIPASADELSFKEARKALPKGNRVVAEQPEATFLDEKEQAIIASLKETIPYYGALALSPDEGLFVDWLNAAAQHHSLQSARDAALAHCEANRKRASAKCVVVFEVSPKGADPEAEFSLSAEAAAALRSDYRKLKSPKAFAISASKGSYGFAGGDGARALDSCKKAGEGATDCKVVVAD